MKLSPLLIAAAISTFISLPLYSKALTLEIYLNDVRNNHKDYLASKKTGEAALLKKEESHLSTSPIITASIQDVSDNAETANPNAQGTRTNAKALDFAFIQKTDYGIQGKVGFNYSDATIKGGSPIMIPSNDFSTSKVSFEVSQSLLKNYLGSETEAQKQIAQVSFEISSQAERFKRQGLLIDAQIRYWVVSLSQEVVTVSEEALERAQALLKWAKKRWQNQLSDKGDFLSAEANLKARELDLDNARYDLKNAVFAFNSMRGLSSNQLFDELSRMSVSDADALLRKLPKNTTRLDVKIASSQVKMIDLQKKLGKEKYEANLEWFASIIFNGRDDAPAEALREPYSTKYPTRVIGLKFSKLLGGDSKDRYLEGLNSDLLASQTQLEHKKYQAEQDKKDLLNRYEDFKTKMIVLKDLERAQKTKLEHERIKHSNGRSTTFQVLNYEGEYSMVQLLIIKNTFELLKVASQLQLFLEDHNV